MGGCSSTDIMTTHIKELVSKRKRRFVEDGFNLDLTYISDRVIAMGFPATSIEAIYRNSIDDVIKMLETKHKDHYKLYNLCSERSYDPKKFQNRVVRYPFDDHQPPEFGKMKPFCEDVDRWLKENENNVAVVHCKAGKGRTGLMICAYLLHCRHSLTAEEVLNYYATKRTMDEKGVTIPSQRRYVDYYAAMINENLQYSPVKLYLYSFVIDPLPSLGLGQEGYISFEVQQTMIRPYYSKVYQVKRTDGRINIVLPQPLLLVGDVKIEFFQKHEVVFNFRNGPKISSKLFHFWVNTFFIDLERSNPLTHEITEPSHEELFTMNLAPPVVNRSSGLTHESLSSRPSLPLSRQRAAVPATDGGKAESPRNCRSTHNSGGGADEEKLPPPRQLWTNLTGAAGGGKRSSDLEDENDLEARSPNGSCYASVSTIHSHPPARTVSIIEPSKQVEFDCDRGVKMLSISDDQLTEQGTQETTQSSFNSKRTRHSSVPMPSKTGSTNQTRFTRHIPGKLMSVRLRKNQIDRADKDKSNKFSENFNVTLFLVRPNDQTLQDEFSRPNAVCQHADDQGAGKDLTDACSWGGGEADYLAGKNSSDEDTPQVSHRYVASMSHPGEELTVGDVCHSEPHLPTQANVTSVEIPTVTSTSTSNLSTSSGSLSTSAGNLSTSAGNLAAVGMVRNQSEPSRPFTQLTSVSHSTWI